MSSVPLSPPPLPAVAASFSGDRREFRRLVTRGAAIELVTVGFYRFWLATDIRRHLWSHTALDGDALEYTGRGKELLVGFLFALAILVPIYLAYFLVGIEAERFKAFASVPLFVFFYVFGQFAIYRARRYRLTRTVWRGVRFWMEGSGWAYAARAALWAVLMPLTLGLILPWREAALERYKMRHSHYGDLRGRFEGTGWDFFKRGWWIWLLAVSPLLVVAIVSSLARFSVSRPQWTVNTSQITGFLTFVTCVTLVMLLLAPFVYAAFRAVEWRWWLSGIRFGDVRFESTLSRAALIGLYWKVIGWFVLIVAVFNGYIFVCLLLVDRVNQVPAEQYLTIGELQGNILFLVLAAIGYLAFILLFNIVMRVYLMRDVWVKLVGSTQVQGLATLADVSVRGDLASAVGEGLADGLDVVGF
jgi:uncharacterized membrane protein YjgN (DUF898 family)